MDEPVTEPDSSASCGSDTYSTWQTRLEDRASVVTALLAMTTKVFANLDDDKDPRPQPTSFSDHQNELELLARWWTLSPSEWNRQVHAAEVFRQSSIATSLLLDLVEEYCLAMEHGCEMTMTQEKKMIGKSLAQFFSTCNNANASRRALCTPIRCANPGFVVVNAHISDDVYKYVKTLMSDACCVTSSPSVEANKEVSSVGAQCPSSPQLNSGHVGAPFGLKMPPKISNAFYNGRHHAAIVDRYERVKRNVVEKSKRSRQKVTGLGGSARETVVNAMTNKLTSLDDRIKEGVSDVNGSSISGALTKVDDAFQKVKNDVSHAALKKVATAAEAVETKANAVDERLRARVQHLQQRHVPVLKDRVGTALGCQNCLEEMVGSDEVTRARMDAIIEHAHKCGPPAVLLHAGMQAITEWTSSALSQCAQCTHSDEMGLH